LSAIAKRHPAFPDGVCFWRGQTCADTTKLRLIVLPRAITMTEDEEDYPSPHFQGREPFRRRVSRPTCRYQGKTLDELAQNLREAIALQLEGENPADFGLAENPSILASFELEPLVHAET
jgi:hypothetical protein